MHIVKWFVEKAKQVVRKHQAKRMGKEVRHWLDEWRGAVISTRRDDEEMERQKEDYLAEYEKQCKEENERQDQIEKEILEEKRLKRLLDDDATEAYFEKKYPRCPDCGLRSPHCSCDE